MNEREIEVKYSFDRSQLSEFLKKIAGEVVSGKVKLGGQEIALPENTNVEYEFEKEGNVNELEIEIKWYDTE